MKIIKFHITNPFLIFFLLLFCFSCSTEPSSNKHQDFIIDEITIDDIHSGYKSDKFTVKDIVKKYIDRIEQIDRNGPTINSVIIVNPDALVIADSLDQIHKQGGVKGPSLWYPRITQR